MLKKVSVETYSKLNKKLKIKYMGFKSKNPVVGGQKLRSDVFKKVLNLVKNK